MARMESFAAWRGNCPRMKLFPPPASVAGAVMRLGRVRPPSGVGAEVRRWQSPSHCPGRGPFLGHSRHVCSEQEKPSPLAPVLQPDDELPAAGP